MMSNSRRNFLKTMGIGCVVAMHPISLISASPIQATSVSNDELTKLSNELLIQWCDELIKYQIKDRNLNELYGGLLCPACNRIHGRCADAIYPLMHVANKTNNPKYLKAALLLFEWMETNVSLPDGSWVNDVNVSDWIGTTVFTAITLCETLQHHDSLLTIAEREKWMLRLRKAADFVHKTFHIRFSNVNYPISAAYALTILGGLFDDESYKAHGKALAEQSMPFFTENDSLLYGEGGKNRGKISPKGCHPVDLGYNVEESLPALAMYALLSQDKKILKQVVSSLKSHAEFMLPDGAWDNSWGTRNFKWTYWGSRTSDGCQTAYALLADYEPMFYKVALQNTILLKECSQNGLLATGLHPHTDNQPTCIHHTFTHAKALTAYLDKQNKNSKQSEELELPREQNYGVKYFKDIQTWLVATDTWKATVTGYDFEYTFKNGHPSGGALSMLWHSQLGPILSASMNDYRLVESPNMQYNKDPHSIPLTARVQTSDGKFMSISDLSSKISYTTRNNSILFKVNSKLVDAEQMNPSEGEINCEINYLFESGSLIIEVKHDATNPESIQLVVPVISQPKEDYKLMDSKSLTVYKPKGQVDITTNKEIQILPTLNNSGRFFNHVPGFSAIPIFISGNDLKLQIITNHKR